MSDDKPSNPILVRAMAERDALMLGAGYIRILANGETEYLDPRDVLLRPKEDERTKMSQDEGSDN